MEAATAIAAADVLHDTIAVKPELGDSAELLLSSSSSPMSGHVAETVEQNNHHHQPAYVDFHEIFGQHRGDARNDKMEHLNSAEFRNSHYHDHDLEAGRQQQQQSFYDCTNNDDDDQDDGLLPSNRCSSLSSPRSSSQSSGDTSAIRKRFPCPECGKLFGRVSHVRRHQLLHTGDKPFECDVCGDRFTRTENRDRHMSMHTKQRPYNCEHCGKGFTQLNRLKVHRLTHTGERPFTCALCLKCFLRVDHLRVHMRTHRNDDATGGDAGADAADWDEAQIERRPRAVVSRKRSRCQAAGVQRVAVAERSAVVDVKHETAAIENGTANVTAPVDANTTDTNAETPAKKHFQCVECPKRFTRRDHFQRHIAVHSGARPFECDLCTKTFSRKDNKYSHMVGCLLKNYGILVETGVNGGAGEVPRGQLQRTVDERVREALGNAFLEPVTQLEEYGLDEDEEDAGGEAVQLLSADGRENGDEHEHDTCVEETECGDADSLETVDSACQSVVESEFNHESTPVHPLGMLKVRDLHELAIQPQLQLQLLAAEPVDANGCCEPEATEDLPLINEDIDAMKMVAFRCGACDKHFQNKSHLVRHAALHTRDRPFRCDQCDKAFNRKEHLQRHVIVHTGIKPFRCAFCDRSFVEQNQQRRHVLEEHAAEAAATVTATTQQQQQPRANGTPNAEDANGSQADADGGCMMDSGEAQLSVLDGLYHCDRCTRTYINKQRLRRHYAGHTGDKPYQCDYCEQRFSRAEHKRRHMAIHTNEKRFECEFCERRFIRADHMLAHVKTHVGVLPYKCAVCADRFGSAKEKMEHMRRHTGAYRCEMCLERFESFGDLSEHRRDIHLQGAAGEAANEMPESGGGGGGGDDEETTTAMGGTCSNDSGNGSSSSGVYGNDSALMMTQMMMMMEAGNGGDGGEIVVGRNEQYPCPVCKRYFGIGRLGDHLSVHIANDDDVAVATAPQCGQPMYADGMEVGRMTMGGGRRWFGGGGDGGAVVPTDVIDEEALRHVEQKNERQQQQQEKPAAAATTSSLLWSAMKVEDGEEILVCDAETVLTAKATTSAVQY